LTPGPQGEERVKIVGRGTQVRRGGRWVAKQQVSEPRRRPHIRTEKPDTLPAGTTKMLRNVRDFFVRARPRRSERVARQRFVPSDWASDPAAGEHCGPHEEGGVGQTGPPPEPPFLGNSPVRRRPARAPVHRHFLGTGSGHPKQANKPLMSIKDRHCPRG